MIDHAGLFFPDDYEDVVAEPRRAREAAVLFDVSHMGQAILRGGDLAALINLANEHPRSKETGVQVTLVAGARSLPIRTPVSSFLSLPT